MILMFEAYAKDYKDPRWMTFKQAKELGGNVRKGEHATHCIRWQPIEIDDKDKEGKPILDSEGNELKHKILIPCPYAVFNVKQIDGLQLPPLIKTEHQWEPHERAEALILNSQAKIVNLKPTDPQTPCYCFSKTGEIDEIRMPKREQFHDAGNYYGTLLHELSHWTGHPSRMGRFKEDVNSGFGSPEYAREELRAEIGSSLLCATIGVPHDLGNNKAYVQSWAERLDKDPKEILYATASADKIVSYLRQYDPVKDKAITPLLTYNKDKISEKELNSTKQQAATGIKERITVAVNDRSQKIQHQQRKATHSLER